MCSTVVKYLLNLIRCLYCRETLPLRDALFAIDMLSINLIDKQIFHQLFSF